MQQHKSNAFKILVSLFCLVIITSAACKKNENVTVVQAEPKVDPPKSINNAELESWIQEQKEAKIVLVDYWATWCIPCIQKYPKIMEIEQKYRDKGLVVLAINMNEESDALPVVKFLEHHKPTFAQRMSRGKTGDAFGDFDLDSLPVYRLHKPDGEILQTFDGKSEFSEIEEAVKKALEL